MSALGRPARLNTDRSVSALKGPNRPVIHQDERARVLAALAAVDGVVLFDEDTPVNLIRDLRPDVLAKGTGFAEEQIAGTADVKSWRGRIVLIPLVQNRSTSAILDSVSDGPVD